MVMSFYELPDEERPPETIWLDAEELDKHFKAVEVNRKAKYSGLESVPEAGELVENEHAAALLRRR